MFKQSNNSPKRVTKRHVILKPIVLIALIKAYKNQPCLWKKTHIGYKSKSCKAKALAAILEDVQKHDPDITMATVVKKIDTIRSYHRKTRTKIEKKRKNMKPPLWYYEMLSFLDVREARRAVYRDVDYVDRCEEIQKSLTEEIHLKQESEEETADDETTFDQSIDNYSANYSLATSMVEVSDSTKQYQYDDENKATKRHCTEVEDEYDAIGVNVAAKLRNLPNNARILAEKLINDVLFQAQLNGLNSSTVISTPDPFKQDPL